MHVCGTIPFVFWDISPNCAPRGAPQAPQGKRSHCGPLPLPGGSLKEQNTEELPLAFVVLSLAAHQRRLAINRCGLAGDRRQLASDGGWRPASHPKVHKVRGRVKKVHQNDPSGHRQSPGHVSNVLDPLHRLVLLIPL